MVEFYFAQLVEEVRNASASGGWPPPDDADESARHDTEEPAAPRRGSFRRPLNFCEHGCYWHCEHE